MTDNYTYIEQLIQSVSNKRRPCFAPRNYRGGFDSYQQTSLIFACIGIAVPFSCVIFGLTFLLLEPRMLCRNGLGEWDSCTRDTACADGTIYRIDYSDPDTIRNLVTYLGNICDDTYHKQLALIGTFMLLGFLIGSVVLTPQVDIIGRRPMLILMMFGSTASLVLFLCAMVFWGSIALVSVSIFLGGLCSLPMFSVMIIYMNEVMTREMAYTVISVALIVESLVGLLTGAYFYYFKNCAVFYSIFVFWLFCASVVCMQLVTETPHFLFKKRRYHECLDQLALMAHFNGYTGHELPTVNQLRRARDSKSARFNFDTEQDRLEKQALLGSKDPEEADCDNGPALLSTPDRSASEKLHEEPTYWESMRTQFRILTTNKQVFQNTVILCITWTCSSYSFYFCEFYLRYVPTNTIYAQKMYMGLSDMFSCVLTYFIASSLSTVRVFTLLFGLLVVSSLSLFITMATTTASDPEADLSP